MANPSEEPGKGDGSRVDGARLPFLLTPLGRGVVRQLNRAYERARRQHAEANGQPPMAGRSIGHGR